MYVKLKEEGHQCPLLPTPCWHINEKTCSHVIINTQKPFELEGETCLFGTNCDKDDLSFEPQLSQQPTK
jgi:hypothetical protein